MEFTIGNKVHELKFGMRFVREMDKRHKFETEGITFGMGVGMAVQQIEMRKVTILSDVIASSLAHLNQVPKESQIDTAIEDYAEANDGLDTLFDDLLDAMGKSKTVQMEMKTFDKKAKTETETAEVTK